MFCFVRLAALPLLLHYQMDGSGRSLQIDKQVWPDVVMTVVVVEVAEVVVHHQRRSNNNNGRSNDELVVMALQNSSAITTTLDAKLLHRRLDRVRRSLLRSKSNARTSGVGKQSNSNNKL